MSASFTRSALLVVFRPPSALTRVLSIHTCIYTYTHTYKGGRRSISSFWWGPVRGWISGSFKLFHFCASTGIHEAGAAVTGAILHGATNSLFFRTDLYYAAAPSRVHRIGLAFPLQKEKISQRKCASFCSDACQNRPACPGVDYCTELFLSSRPRGLFAIPLLHPLPMSLNLSGSLLLILWMILSHLSSLPGSRLQRTTNPSSTVARSPLA